MTPPMVVRLADRRRAYGAFSDGSDAQTIIAAGYFTELIAMVEVQQAADFEFPCELGEASCDQRDLRMLNRAALIAEQLAQPQAGAECRSRLPSRSRRKAKGRALSCTCRLLTQTVDVARHLINRLNEDGHTETIRRWTAERRRQAWWIYSEVFAHQER